MNKDNVRLDINHPLAGKEIFFHIPIKELREAMAEEIEHGHVHGDEEMEFEEDLSDESDENGDEA